jgi:hypothetical protein
LRACCRYDFDLEFLSFLLDQGANTPDQDTSGRSCLHLCVLLVDISPSTNILACLKLLLSKGANPFAVDNDGHSVSHYAYKMDGYVGKYNLKGYRGDFWDAALAQSGIDLHQTRQSYLRVPDSTKNGEPIIRDMFLNNSGKDMKIFARITTTLRSGRLVLGWLKLAYSMAMYRKMIPIAIPTATQIATRRISDNQNPKIVVVDPE